MIAASRSPTSAADVGKTAARPDSGDATMLRTRSWVSDGNSPADAAASATASVSVMPRIWMLPREVSSIVAEPNSVAASRPAPPVAPP